MKKEMRMSDFLQDLSFTINNDLLEMLNYELNVEMKKMQNIPLTKEELFFDTYFIKPSTILKSIYKK